jgi:23S rRNA (uridine2552-2'-O)-methyltransferase
MAAMRDLHDHYFKQAKRDGYRSRAAYKLTEILEKRKLLRRDSVVLDCGCAPGSWIQVVLEQLGPRGKVVGVDLSAIEAFNEEPRARILQGDLNEVPATELRRAAGLDPVGGRFDVILSDMAPNTTGDRTIDHHGSARLVMLVTDLAAELLQPGGALVAKVLEGEVYPELLETWRGRFEKAKGFKPKASRSISTEMFLIGEGYRPLSEDEAAEREHTAPPKRRRPSSGWGDRP